jgi:tetratricopeptide (TPR) repeat protein
LAKLFLSYSRRDTQKALRFTEWLQREGHVVWRDEDDIRGGATFSSEIENALNGCDAVLALWSADSVQSAWVRDEAGFGRDRGKLIPCSLDRTEPPLGFRQFQSIDLSNWKGRGDPPAGSRIRAAIDSICGHSASSAQSTVAREHRIKPAGGVSRIHLVGALLGIVSAGVLGVSLWERWSATRQIAIAVLPSPQSPDRAMATDYANLAAADMAASLPRRFDGASVIAPADAVAQNASYRMLISTAGHGAAANASITLSEANGHSTLWSQSWSVPDASAADLKAQVSESATKAAFCLVDAIGGRSRLSQPTLGLYLTGCTELGDTRRTNEDFVTIFERITRLAPSFPQGWDYLALSRSWIAQSLRDSSPAAHAAAVQSTRDAIAVARKLNPNSAMSYDAEFHLLSGDWFRSLEVLERGARVDPDDGRIQMHLADALQAVGRMSDAVNAGQRSVELAPGMAYAKSEYILALVYSGEFSKAKAVIAEARKKWVNDPAIDYADFSFQFRYGDPRIALQMLPQVVNSSDSGLDPYRKFIAARLDPTTSKIDDALAALQGHSPGGSATDNKLLLALAGFGRIEDVYKLLEDRSFEPLLNKDALFRPEFAKVRADPRFMQVAARLGLVRYWRQTGFWPDFCANERLTYDCKAEAAKIPT